MYDPKVGRWTTEDPIGFNTEDMDLYRYVKNSPTNPTDPSGLQLAALITDLGTLALESARGVMLDLALAEAKGHLRIGSERGTGGTFMWVITPRDQGVAAHFTFTPSTWLKCRNIAFIQVIHKFVAVPVVGRQTPLWPSPEGYFREFATNEDVSNGLDHVAYSGSPYYNARWDRSKWISNRYGTLGSGSHWVSVPFAIHENYGYSGGYWSDGWAATMTDYPRWHRAHRNQGDFVADFETAAFCIDTQEVLGVIRWGFTVPSDPTSPVVLDRVGFSKQVSPEFKALIAKANAHPKMEHKITRPRGDTVGGTSALP